MAHADDGTGEDEDMVIFGCRSRAMQTSLSPRADRVCVCVCARAPRRRVQASGKGYIALGPRRPLPLVAPQRHGLCGLHVTGGCRRGLIVLRRVGSGQAVVGPPSRVAEHSGEVVEHELVVRDLLRELAILGRRAPVWWASLQLGLPFRDLLLVHAFVVLVVVVTKEHRRRS